MSTDELSEELEQAIAAHDLSDEHAIRTRELVEQGVPVLDAIRQAAAEHEEEEVAAAATPEPPAELTEPTEDMVRAVVKENERHEKNVHKIMGTFTAGFGQCTACGGLGLEEPGPKPREHAFFAACKTCAGYGEVLTGSLEPQYRGVKCPDCGGRGYLELMLDNTTAIEMVEQWRQNRRQLAQAPPPVVLEASGEGAPAEAHMGRPSWMGDPAVGG